MSRMAEQFNNSTRILIPSGRDYDPCVQAFEEMFDVEVPDFADRKLITQSAERQFIKVKSKDMAALIEGGYADMGVAGTDVFEEQVLVDESNLIFEVIGDRMCTFDLLAPENSKEEILARITGEGSPLKITTSLPRLLGKSALDSKLNIVPATFSPSGSLEAMVFLGLSSAIADLVQTGKTSQVNGLATIQELKKVYPAVLWQGSTRQTSNQERGI